MRLPKRGERGFTLIELLIVVAILGVLAAVVIPNLQQFIGAGGEEAKKTELANIQAAVSAMMVDNELATLTTPVVDDITYPRTNNMKVFPDQTLAADKVKHGTENYTQVGYVLYGNEIGYDSTVPPDGIVDTIRLVNYVVQETTTYWYSVDAYGTVEQYDEAPAP